jgi:hypothetical protein
MRKKDSFIRYVVLGHSPVLSDRQTGWTGRWCLMGDVVLCSQCLAAQAIEQAHEPFEHMPGCVARHEGLHPWHELQYLLTQLPPLPTTQ